jgi:hypothetical protein
MAMVARAAALTATPEVDKVVLSRLIDITTRERVDSGALLERLIAQNPASFNFHVPLSDGGVLLGASPELLLRKEARISALCRWPARPVASRTMCWIAKRATGWPRKRSPRARAGDPGDEGRAGAAQPRTVAAGLAAADHHADAVASGDAD